MRSTISAVLGAVCVLAIVPPVAGGASAPLQSPPGGVPDRALLDKYCVTCHNERLQTAGLSLAGLDPARVESEAEVWEKVARKLRTGAMPPAGAPRPPRPAADGFAASVEARLDQVAASNPNPGRPALHRLNRFEYTNAIRDLLALEVDGEALLPTDESGYGFDNIADVLTLSPALLERYMTAAWKISRLAVGDPTMRPTVQTYRFPMPLVQDDRMGEDLPFRSRGGSAIRHYFPLDGEYLVRIQLHRTWTSPVIRGLTNREQIDVRLDGQRLKVFTVGGECVDSDDERCKRPPGVIPASDYERTADDGLEFRVKATAGQHVLGISFLKRIVTAVEGSGASRMPAGHPTFLYAADVDMSIDSVRIEGPFQATAPEDTPSRRRIFVCHPGAAPAGHATAAEERQCAETILSPLARRAYRRPVTERDLRTLIEFYQQGQEKGGFDAGIQLALERLLVSPDFLFRVEHDAAGLPPGSAYPLTDLEMASRLSFFLWSSLPDDELLELGERGRLRAPGVLARQVTRMLADPRATAFVTNFFGQWLYLRNMHTVTPDPEAFPAFDDVLRKAFLRETELFIESQVREDHRVLDLLSADYTFLNERLAKHYGVPNVYGSHFRRVAVEDENRQGLLGHGSVLTVTSYATRTSPVVRGKWLLENLLGAPPPPPPANVPALRENDVKTPPASVRERLEQHRRNPACASCHARMDPLGFALENFDGIGQWRTVDASVPINASGALPDGAAFDGPTEFRAVLLQNGEEFVRTAAEKLLTYAAGRGLEFFDEPAVRRIVREAGGADARWSSLVLAVATSAPFQMKTAGPSGRDNSANRRVQR